MDTKQMEVEQIFRVSTADELQKVANAWELPEGDWKDKQSREVLRKLQDKLDEDMIDEETKEKLYLKTVPCLSSSNSQKMMKVLLGQRDEVLNSTNVQNVSVQELLQSSTLRKDLKINGIIGGSREREQVTYMGLLSQVDEARVKEYSDDEIARSVRKIVAPGCSLRTLLDAKPDMTLQNVLALIRSFLKEKSSTELFQELNNTCQRENEDAQEFVLRAMELREKIIMASDADGALKYDSQLVQDMFTHTVRTGLLDEGVRGRLDPFLTEGVRVTDEFLISKVNTASSEEKERQNKQNKTKRVMVNQVQTTTGAMSADMQSVMQGMREMKEKINEIQLEMMQSRRGNVTYGRARGGSRGGFSLSSRGRGWGCQSCREHNCGFDCRHCFRCGEESHRAYECPKATQDPLNLEGLGTWKDASQSKKKCPIVL